MRCESNTSACADEWITKQLVICRHCYCTDTQTLRAHIDRAYKKRNTDDNKRSHFASNIDFGVWPFRNGSIKECSNSVCVMTAVCDVAGITARREAGNGLPISPMAPPPRSLNIAT